VLRPVPAAVHIVAANVSAAQRLRKIAVPVAALASTTLVSGPFVAGNDAGLAYNDWPYMAGDVIPPEVPNAVRSLPGGWRQFCEETAVVQFDHRLLAYTTVAGSAGLAVLARRSTAAPAVRSAATLLFGTTAAQLVLGVATLMSYVPISLGVAHQGGGVAVWSALLILCHTLRLPLPR